MSLAASSLVWDHSRATGSALLVLLSLAERANRDHAGVCWSKIKDVATRSRIGPRQAYRAIDKLVELRELYVHVAHGPGATCVFVVTCGRTREFVANALVEHLRMPRDVAESIASRVTNPVGIVVTDDNPPTPPIRKNQHEPLENHDRRRRAPSPACAPARIDDDDDFLELILDEFERQTGRQRKPADEVAARTLRGVAFESVRRGIARSVAAVGDGRVSSLRYCVPAIQEFERGRIHAGIGAAPRPVAVPDPEPEVDGDEQLEVDGAEYSKSDKDPVWAEVKKFLERSAAMHGRVPDHGEIRAHLIFECGHDPGLIEAMYPTGNGSSASSRGQVFTTAEAVKE